MHSLTVESIARRVNGTVIGDAQRSISGAESLAKAKAGDVTFAAGEKHLKRLAQANAGACLVARSKTQPTLPENGMVLIVVDDPQDAFIAILREFRPQRPRPSIGISPAAHISPTAQLGPDCNVFPGAYIDDGVVIGARCDIYPGVYIGADCRIGDDCVLHPQVVFYPDVVIGQRVIVHANAVLGADGFGYRFRNGRFEKIPQQGWVHVHDDCEIGACTTIDRGMIGATVIGAGTKLDNLVMIGHNCELGKHNVFASQVGFAGSITTGDYVRCAGQVGIADHVHLGTNSSYGAKTGIHRDMPANGTYLGAPALPDREQMRIMSMQQRLPEMRHQLRELEQQVAKLTAQMEAVTAAALPPDSRNAA